MIMLLKVLVLQYSVQYNVSMCTTNNMSDLIYMSQVGKRVWKRDNGVWNLCNIWYIWHRCQQMCRQTMVVLPHMHSGFPTKIMEQMIVTSLYDIMRFSHVTEGGHYKKRV